jgi:hypothetical protein
MPPAGRAGAAGAPDPPRSRIILSGPVSPGPEARTPPYDAGDMALTLVPLPGPVEAAGTGGQPLQGNNTAGMQQNVPPAHINTLKPVYLPVTDLPSASMSDSTRTHLCQQLVRAVLAAACALYAAPPSNRLAGLAQQLLSAPGSHLIQFLERLHKVHVLLCSNQAGRLFTFLAISKFQQSSP